ncbi:protamine-like protein 99C [Drosophila rhopaloa]|uniref:Uncharacterized protein LOC108049057 n=1 Tax=Drosophila rhopaloa TaxID=1041015 RepID=A0A6P4FE36_DRORH|nr:protamine-like protein 99C [Drosophila rhopaloa]
MEEKKRGRSHYKPIYKYQKVARILNNGYLNFLTEYKKRFCGLSPQDMVRFGAKQWNLLSLEEKQRFKNMKESVAVKKSSTTSAECQSEKEWSSNTKEPTTFIKRPPQAAEWQEIKESRCNMKESVNSHRSAESQSTEENCSDMEDTLTLKLSPLWATEWQSIKECSAKHETEKLSQNLSPYAREREATRTSYGSKNCQSKRKSPLKSQAKYKSPSKTPPNIESPLGTAGAYIHFIRNFKRQNYDLSANDLLKRAVRLWCRLDSNQRQKFERPLWIINTG